MNDGQTEPEKPPVPVQASDIPSSPSPADKLNDGKVHSGENEIPELETPDSVSEALETLDSEEVIPQEPTDAAYEISP